MRQAIVGIDIGSYALKAVVAKPSATTGAVIEQFFCQPLPFSLRDGQMPAEALQAAVIQLLKLLTRKPRRAAVNVPLSACLLKPLSLAACDESVADKGIDDPWLMSEVQVALMDALPFTLDQVAIDVVALPDAIRLTDDNNLLAVACPRDIVVRAAQCIDTIGFRHTAVDVGAFALGQVVECVLGGATPQIVIDIGYQTAIFLVFQHGSVVKYQPLDMGGNQLSEWIATALDVSIDIAEQLKHQASKRIPQVVLEDYYDAFCEQLSRALAALDSHEQLSQDSVYLTGGGSLLVGLNDALHRYFPSYRFAPLAIGQRLSSAINSSVASGALAATALGLTMRRQE